MAEEEEEEVEEEEEEIVSSSSSSSSSYRPELLLVDISQKLQSGDLSAQIGAAREIRNLVRRRSSSSSTRSRLGAGGVIEPLVQMLWGPTVDARHASLVALLNLAVRHDRNKISIVCAGAVPPLVELLRFQNGDLRELATAAILTLSAAPPNKPTIAASGAVPLLVHILSSATLQGRVDAVAALHNLASAPSLLLLLDVKAASPLIHLLRDCKNKSSKFAHKATALLEILSHSEDGRAAISSCEAGILTLVETVEEGSLASTQHAVGALLSLCASCRDTYRGLILKEGAIPGLLRLTAEGTALARDRARELLDLLRETPEEKETSSVRVLEKFAYDIAARVDGAEKAPETAKKLLQEMVQRRSMARIQHRASSSAG